MAGLILAIMESERQMAHRAKTKANHRECCWSRVERYKATRTPRCNGGDGCHRCWHKWHIVNVRGGRDDRPAATEGATPCNT